MSDFAFFGVFFLIVIFIGSFGVTGHGIFSNSATSTSSFNTYKNQTISSESGSGSNSGYNSNATVQTQPVNKLSNQEIEQRVASIYQQLDSLSEAIRKQKLREPASPYADMIELQSGNARDTNVNQEYVTLYAKSNNVGPINISHWYLKSYVTGDSAALPQGDRLLAKRNNPQQADILLDPGEYAYLTTGKSPIDTSFRENMCSGYFQTAAKFYPSLSASCPYPSAEFKRYANVPLNDDSCYAFMNRVGTCNTIDDDTIAGLKLSGGCRSFLVNTFNHDDCIIKHQHDPLFDRGGYWHIYLKNTDELWRSQREIIRLMDENDRVVSVLEY